jgi:ABC-type lipoprotein release transport system permease subunit
VHHPEFLINYDIQDSIPNPEAILGRIKAREGVKAASSRTVLTGMVMSANSAAGIRITVTDPLMEKEVTTIPEKIPDSSGSYFVAGKRNQVILSQKTADKLKVKVRSKVILRYQQADGTLVDGAYKVAGIFKTTNAIFDESTLFVDRKDLTAQSGIQPPVHEIVLLLEDNRYLKNTKEWLKSEYPSLNVMDWKELQPELGMLTGMLTISMYFILGIILAALAFGIVNTMLMVVLERTHELGMLMAVGMNRRKLFGMIMLETVFLALVGGITGMVLSILLTWFTASSGIDLTAFAKGFEAMGYEAVIYPELRADFFFGTVALVIVTGILASVYPARMALKINPANAVRGE